MILKYRIGMNYTKLFFIISLDIIAFRIGFALAQNAPFRFRINSRYIKPSITKLIKLSRENLLIKVFVFSHRVFEKLIHLVKGG